MTAFITIRINYSDYRYELEIQQLSPYAEHITVKGKNKSLVFRSNRSAIKRRGLKHWDPELQLIEGTVSDKQFLDTLKEAIIRQLKEG